MTLAPLLAASAAVQAHTVFATTALVMSAVVAFCRKGTPLHRALGRLAALALVLAALTSFLILRQGSFSVIHLLSLVTLVSVTGGLISLRRGNRRSHACFMSGAVSGLVGAALLTLAPGRLMHSVVFGM